MLITGVTGVAGYGALAYFQSRLPGEVYGAVQETDVDFPAAIASFIRLITDVAETYASRCPAFPHPQTRALGKTLITSKY